MLTFGDRLNKFIQQNFGSNIRFAEIVGVKFTSVSRYIYNKSMPGGEMLSKFYESGLSIDWLISGNGSMYSINSEGRKLKMKYQESKEIPTTPFGRLKYWINDNYRSLENYCMILNIDADILTNILYDDMIPDSGLITTIRKSGCNIQWLVSGSGDEYENNPAGVLLKMKKHENYDEEKTNEEKQKLLNKLEVSKKDDLKFLMKLVVD